MIPTPLSKERLLHDLRVEIEKEVADPWLFPQIGVVAGFMGTCPLTIVGRRPSMSPFPNREADHLLYAILAEFGLENVHLTNLIKTRGQKGAPNPNDLSPHFQILRRELEIVSGEHAVVSMGDAHEAVADLLMKRGCKPLARLPQYASMNYGEDRVTIFRRHVEELAKRARAIGWIR